MGILGGNRTTQQSSGGVLGRRQREEEEQRRQKYQSMTAAAPELFNPMAQQAAIQERYSPAAIEEAAAESAVQRQQSALDSPLTKVLTGIQGVANKVTAPIRNLLPAPKTDTVGQRALQTLGDYRSNVQRAQANNPVGAFIGGAGDAATLGLTSYAERLAGNPDIADRFTESTPGKIGQFAGMAVLPAGRMKAGASLLSNMGRGAVAGGVLGAGIEAGEAATGRNDQSLVERALDTAIGAGMGAGGVAAFAGIGSLVRAASNKAKNAAEGILGRQLKTANAIESASQNIPATQLDVPVMKNNAVPDHVNVPLSPDLPAADSSLGISPMGTKGKYADTDTRSHIATKTTRDKVDVGKLTDDFYTKNVNNLQWLDNFDKYIEKSTGNKLRPDERSYMLALNSRGADMTARHILTERMVDSQGRVIGKSLKDITSQIPSNKQVYDNFVDYLIARHAPTRMERGEKVYSRKLEMTPDSARAKVDEYEKNYPQFATLAEDLDNWNDTIGRAWLVDTGIVPESMFNAWRKENPFWIPNKRHFSELEKRQQAIGARRGFGNQNNPVKAYSETGSERKIIDPFESLIEYTDRYVKTARRNEVMQTIYRQLQKHPDELDGFATILKKEKLDEKAMGADGVAGLIDDLDDEFGKALLRKSDLDKDNVISALVDGERVYMRVENPDFLDALVNVTPITRHVIVEGARKITSAMKLLTTGINPIFGLTRNIFRDIPESFVYSKTTNNPFRYAWDTLESFVSVFADGADGAVRDSRLLQKVTPESFRRFLDNRARLYKDYKALGGGHSSPAAANRNLLAQSKRDLLPQQRKGLGIGRRGWAALENLNNALESGPRLGEFKRSRKAGSDTYGSRVQGIFEAQDVTTNFKRHGQIVREADAFIPYLNAAVQGLDKFARSFKDQPAAVTAKALSVIAAPTIALYALNYNNENYKKLNNYTKDNFYLIPTDDGKFIKIPKPRELGVPFGGLLERTMRAWNEDDPEAFRDFAETASAMFVPPGIPLEEIVKGDLVGVVTKPLRDTVFGPLVDVATNKNFTGAPVVPGYLEGLSPRYQFDANTSEVSKKIGDLLNVSPKQLDHVIRSYTGMIGQVGLPATTKGATLGDTLSKQVTADSVFSTDASKYFYELKDKIDTQYADAKHTGVAPKGYNDEARKYLNKVASQMSEYTKAIREIDDSNLDRETKKEYKRQITERRNDLARDSYIAVRDALRSD